MAKKIWDEDITGYEQDWGGDDSTGNLPISGRAVQKFLKQELNSRVGYMIKPDGSNAYYWTRSRGIDLTVYDNPNSVWLIGKEGYAYSFNYYSEYYVVARLRFAAK